MSVFFHPLSRRPHNQTKRLLSPGLAASFVILTMAVMPASACAAAPQASTEKSGKLTNNNKALKAAFKRTGYGNSLQALDQAEVGDMAKIAALETDNLKGDAALSPPELAGDFVQGGLVLGQTVSGSTVRLDTLNISVNPEGRFILGFGRDHPATALLTITYPDGSAGSRVLNIENREFKVQRIDGLPSNKVSTFSKDDLVKIKISTDKKKTARSTKQGKADWASGFMWPVTGRISGVFGSQRVLNGEPKRPHSGVDVAAPTGTIVLAPAAGIVTLAEPSMFFEGGLVFIDHGQGLESALMHMSRIDVKAGDRIEKGTPIGAVGATGRATGPHLHWSLKWKKRLLDAQLVVGEMPKS